MRKTRGVMPLNRALKPSCWKSVRAIATVWERLEWPGGVALRWTSVSVTRKYIYERSKVKFFELRRFWIGGEKK